LLYGGRGTEGRGFDARKWQEAMSDLAKASKGDPAFISKEF